VSGGTTFGHGAAAVTTFNIAPNGFAFTSSVATNNWYTHYTAEVELF
jgi:hypothetical protein